MLAIAISVALGLVVAVATLLAFPWWASILPALATMVATYVFIVRKVNGQLQKAMQGVQGALMQRNIDGALTVLEGIKQKFGRWVLFLNAQIDGQIGGIYFLKKDFEKARPYLEKSFTRMWEPKVMLGVLASGQLGGGKGDMKKVDEIFEGAARYSPKQGLMWSTWAYLHWKAGDAKRAVEILARGKQILGEADALLSQNLLALQNDKKLKMKGYGDPWYQLHLEQHPMVMQAQRGGNVRFARR
jgi:tetratricopeptide (TPR) repeat protein